MLQKFIGCWNSEGADSVQENQQECLNMLVDMLHQSSTPTPAQLVRVAQVSAIQHHCHKLCQGCGQLASKYSCWPETQLHTDLLVPKRGGRLMPQIESKTSVQEASLGHAFVSGLCERYLASSANETLDERFFDHKEWKRQKDMMLLYIQLSCSHVSLGLQEADAKMTQVCLYVLSCSLEQARTCLTG